MKLFFQIDTSKVSVRSCVYKTIAFNTHVDSPFLEISTYRHLFGFSYLVLFRCVTKASIITYNRENQRPIRGAVQERRLPNFVMSSYSIHGNKVFVRIVKYEKILLSKLIANTCQFFSLSQ